MSGCLLFWIKTWLLQNIMGFKWFKSPLRISDSRVVSKNIDWQTCWTCQNLYLNLSRIVKISDKHTSYPWYDFLPITKNLFMFSLLCFRCLFLLWLWSLLGPLSVFSICVHFVFARFLLLCFLPIPSCGLREGNQQCTVGSRYFEKRTGLILFIHWCSTATVVLPGVSCLMLINKVASGRKRALLFLILLI